MEREEDSAYPPGPSTYVRGYHRLPQDVYMQPTSVWNGTTAEEQQPPPYTPPAPLEKPHHTPPYSPMSAYAPAPQSFQAAPQHTTSSNVSGG